MGGTIQHIVGGGQAGKIAVANRKLLTPPLRRAYKGASETEDVMGGFKNPTMRHCYQTARKLGADTSSEMYHDGRPRTGASPRVAYWHGRAGIADSMYAKDKAALAYAFYSAGRDDRKRDVAKGNPCPKPELPRMGGPIFPKWTPTA